MNSIVFLHRANIQLTQTRNAAEDRNSCAIEHHKNEVYKMLI